MEQQQVVMTPQVSVKGKPKPGRMGYVIAGALLLAAIAWFAFTIGDAIEQVKPDLTRVDVPGSATYEVTDPGRVTIFHEVPSGDTPGSLPDARVTVTDPGGEPVDVGGSVVSETYTFGGRSGAGVATFRAQRAGDYEIEATGSAEKGHRLAVGRLEIGESFKAIGKVALPAGVLLLGAIAAFATTLIRRLTWKPAPNSAA